MCAFPDTQTVEVANSSSFVMKSRGGQMRTVRGCYTGMTNQHVQNDERASDHQYHSNVCRHPAAAIGSTVFHTDPTAPLKNCSCPSLARGRWRPPLPPLPVHELAIFGDISPSPRPFNQNGSDFRAPLGSG
jgi:hypothetical protein